MAERRFIAPSDVYRSGSNEWTEAKRGIWRPAEGESAPKFFVDLGNFIPIPKPRPRGFHDASKYVRIYKHGEQFEDEDGQDVDMEDTLTTLTEIEKKPEEE